MADNFFGKPYTEVIEDGVKIRVFSANCNTIELVWHRDRESRKVQVIEGEGWYLQLDNCVPQMLKKDNVYVIPKMTYHRVLQGTTDLVVRISDYI